MSCMNPAVHFQGMVPCEGFLAVLMRAGKGPASCRKPAACCLGLVLREGACGRCTRGHTGAGSGMLALVYLQGMRVRKNQAAAGMGAEKIAFPRRKDQRPGRMAGRKAHQAGTFMRGGDTSCAPLCRLGFRDFQGLGARPCNG